MGDRRFKEVRSIVKNLDLAKEASLNEEQLLKVAENDVRPFIGDHNVLAVERELRERVMKDLEGLRRQQRQITERLGELSAEIGRLG